MPSALAHRSRSVALSYEGEPFWTKRPSERERRPPDRVMQQKSRPAARAWVELIATNSISADFALVYFSPLLGFHSNSVPPLP